uniref:Uncharacterized protein n=1 Tax=Moniliophthora roreri TaxID=221103 RepID=A0A0W0FD07_MONRR
MSTNVSASTSTASSSAGNQAQGLSSPTPTEAREGRYVFSTDSDNELMEMDIPDLPSRSNSPPPLHRLPNPLPTMPSFILNPLPILTLSRKSSPPSKESLLSTPSSTAPTVQFHLQVKNIVVARGREEDKENKPPQSLHQSMLEIPDNPQWSDRLPPPMPSEMWMDHASALCANWTAISPETSQAIFVGDASTMRLDISLRGALSTDGLRDFCMEGLVQIVVLCQTIIIMMMTDMTITTESDDRTFVVDTNTERREFLFMGVNPKKVRLVDVKKGVEERMIEGWQPGPSRVQMMMGGKSEQISDRPEECDDRPDNDVVPGWAPEESQDYDSELYGDRES